VAQSERAIALAGLGFGDEALALIERIENPRKQQLAVEGAAAALVTAGPRRAAGGSGARGLHETYREHALKAVASELKERADPGGSRPWRPNRTATRASRCFCAAARGFARTGRHERASELIGRALALLERGDGLLGMLDQLEGEALVELAETEAASGMPAETGEHLERAATLANDDDDLRATVAVGFARAGRLERALKMIQAVEFPSDNGTNDALADLAPHLVCAGRISELRDAVVHRGVNSRVVRAVCERLMSAGHVDAALEIWRTGLDTADRGRTCSTLWAPAPRRWHGSTAARRWGRSARRRSRSTPGGRTRRPLPPLPSSWFPIVGASGRWVRYDCV
jgi:hypothetical protein